MSLGVQAEASGSTSHSLLQRVQRHEPEAWRRFAALYGPVVYRWCTSFGLPAHDAADIAQEVFQAVFRHIGEFQSNRSKDSLRGWLYTVTRNKVRDHFRRCAEEPAAAGGTAAYREMQQVPEDLIE